MPKCKDCKFCIGYDVISSCYICYVTEDIEYVAEEWANDNDLGCDLYVNNSNDDTTKSA